MPIKNRPIEAYLAQMCDTIRKTDLSAARRLSDYLYEAWQRQRFIFVFGNGGSGATASHFAEDLGKNALREKDLTDDTKKRPRVMSLTDNTSWITAIANDIGYEQIFVQQLAHYAGPGDFVLAISGSGNSPNVLSAVEWANHRGLVTFGLTGFDGGRLRQIQREGLHVPLCDMGMVESIHHGVLHWIVEEIHERINGTIEP